MGDPITNFISDISHKERKWKNHTITPFAKAWIAAFENFKQTLKDQKESDEAAQKLKLELALLALSLCGGGIMTAAFGTAVAKTLAGNAALEAIRRSNMERAFKAAKFVADNKTASFIAGKVWDDAEKRVSDAIDGKLKGKLTQNEASFPSIGKFRTELDMYLSLDGFISTAAERVNDIAVHVRDHASMPLSQKHDEIAKLATSSFWRPPEKDLDKTVIAEEIELSMYLNLVLESDSLETWETGSRMGSSDGLGRGRESYARRTGKRDITESAGSPDYPVAARDKDGYLAIEYKRIGGIIQDKMNDLHKKKFGGKFHDGRKLGSQDAILAAERALGMLAAVSIKRTIEDAGLDPNRNLHLSTGASGFPTQ